MELRDSGDRFTLLWDCNQPDSEFDVTYQLINTGMCDTENETFSSSPSPVDIISPVRVGYGYELVILKSDLYMYANSTYLFTVQSKQWRPGSGYIYGLCHDSVNITTPERKCNAQNIVLTSFLIASLQAKGLYHYINTFTLCLKTRVCRSWLLRDCEYQRVGDKINAIKSLCCLMCCLLFVALAEVVKIKRLIINY